jgi:hypothetical protein
MRLVMYKNIMFLNNFGAHYKPYAYFLFNVFFIRDYVGKRKKEWL